MLLNFVSYNQHGFNAALLAADLALNRLPFVPHLIGYAGLWSLAFTLWAHAWRAWSGRWLYPVRALRACAACAAWCCMRG